MLGVLSSDAVRMARAMGLSRPRVLWSYALRSALLPVLTTLERKVELKRTFREPLPPHVIMRA